jgi:hypothetical protein
MRIYERGIELNKEGRKEKKQRKKEEKMQGISKGKKKSRILFKIYKRKRVGKGTNWHL